MILIIYQHTKYKLNKTLCFLPFYFFHLYTIYLLNPFVFNVICWYQISGSAKEFLHNESGIDKHDEGFVQTFEVETKNMAKFEHVFVSVWAVNQVWNMPHIKILISCYMFNTCIVGLIRYLLIVISLIGYLLILNDLFWDMFIVNGLSWNMFIVISLKNGSQIVLYKINVWEYWRDNNKWTIQRNWQHRVHNTQDEEKQSKNTTQYVLNTTILKQTQIT